MNEIRPFHLAIPVNNLEVSRHFYGNILGCSEGRSSDQWVDYNFFGHQLVIHLKGPSTGKSRESLAESQEQKSANPVDGHSVPIPHFGVVLDMDEFYELSEAIKKANISFIIEPYMRFKGEVGEQATMFFEDPSGNAIEFKAFKNIDQLFAT